MSKTVDGEKLMVYSPEPLLTSASALHSSVLPTAHMKPHDIGELTVQPFKS